MLVKKEECVGCTACYSICPQEVISMCEDEYGFMYPEVYEEKCIECRLCEKACPVKQKKFERVIE